MNTSDSDVPFGGFARDDEENEELRGVIDDLTVENKRLKKLIKTQVRKQSSASNVSEDKLFEVRVHGLAPEKKRELEQLLKNFATNVHKPAPPMSSSRVPYTTSKLPVEAPFGEKRAPALKKERTDSGYGSNSISEHASAAPSNEDGAYLPVSQRTKSKDIKLYLHDIPDTLLPRQTLRMSDRAKMALVVRRLEQLFTGKNAVPGDHHQPLQQQEVSRSAAKFDQRENNLSHRRSKAEGTREAHILPIDSKVNLDTCSNEPSPLEKKMYRSNSDSGSAAQPSSRLGSPDQRPTRPLDLDIERAQVAAENIQYIRHLGLSSPHLHENGDNNDNPWIYLNLLTGMAQLHTINVTPEFIRHAVNKLSTKFELSKDGHRVRWTGGSEGTTFSKEEERALEATHNHPIDLSEEGHSGSSKRSKTDSSSNALTSNTPSEDKESGNQTNTASKQQTSTWVTSKLQTSDATVPMRLSSFDYKPIRFLGRQRSTRAESYMNDSNSSYESSSGDSSGLINALSRSNISQKPADEGMMTFYSNSHFCTDFSGDKAPVNMMQGRVALVGETLGLPSKENMGESTLRHHDACYFAPQFAAKPYQAAENDAGIDFTPTSISAAGEYETEPIDLPASGLGGVVPDDNFLVDVKVARTKLKQPIRQPRCKIPVTGTSHVSHYQYRITERQRIELLPSQLPSPNYIYFRSSSSSSAADPDLESGSSDTSSEADEAAPLPPSFLNHWSTDSSGHKGEDEDRELVDDSSSVDMLAVARAVDPETIAAQEREYMINQPGGVKATAGSLAATVGASMSESETNYPDIASDGCEAEDSAMGMDSDDE